MKDVSIIGVDLSQQVFPLHAATAEGEVVFRKKLSRKQFLAFMHTQPRCRIAMEACATAHHWARTLAELGHEVRLIAPKFVKPYVKNQKNDMVDAEAIAEASSRPTMGFVEVKSPAQQGLGMIFRLRGLLVGQRTQTINAQGLVPRQHSSGANRGSGAQASPGSGTSGACSLSARWR